MRESGNTAFSSTARALTSSVGGCSGKLGTMAASSTTPSTMIGSCRSGNSAMPCSRISSDTSRSRPPFATLAIFEYIPAFNSGAGVYRKKSPNSHARRPLALPSISISLPSSSALESSPGACEDRSTSRGGVGHQQVKIRRGLAQAIHVKVAHLVDHENFNPKCQGTGNIFGQRSHGLF